MMPAMGAIDVHCYLGRSLFGTSSSVGSILRDMDRLDIETSVLVTARPRGYRLEPGNRRVAAAVAANPNRFMGWCRVDPWQGARAVAELRRGVGELGLRGLFLHPWEENFPVDGELVEPLVAAAGELGVPVMVVGGHVRVSTAWQIADLAGRHPTVTFVATSAGQINISGAALHEAEVMLAEHDNVLAETSGIYREDFIEDMAARFGAGRILWGSGSPVFSRAFEIKRGEWAHLNDEDRAAILGGNARRLFGKRG